MPGTLDIETFPFSDEKLGVVFEDEDMVSPLTFPACHTMKVWEYR